jgi:hypothetical protein
VSGPSRHFTRDSLSRGRVSDAERRSPSLAHAFSQPTRRHTQAATYTIAQLLLPSTPYLSFYSRDHVQSSVAVSLCSWPCDEYTTQRTHDTLLVYQLSTTESTICVSDTPNQSITVVGSENSCAACLYGQTVLLATLDILIHLPPALSHIQIGCMHRQTC